MNWKEIYAIIESKTDGKVYRAGGSVEFDELPEPGEDHLGYVYNVTDAFETTADFVEGAGISYPAGTNVIIVDVGTESEPVYKYDVLSGLYEVDDQMSDVSENPVQNKVVKAAIEEAAEGEEITTTATGSDLTLSTSSGNLNALTVFGKSEVVDGSIKSAGEGWATVDLGTLTWTYREDLEPKQFRVAFPQAEWIYDPNALQPIICSGYKDLSYEDFLINDKCICRYWTSLNGLNVIDTSCTTLTEFQNKINGVILAYQLADPTQGNCIAVKTDNGSGIDGTMAVFETGTPLRSIPDSNVRDVMEWNGSAGEVTKNCGKVRLANLTWGWWNLHPNVIYAQISGKQIGLCGMICSAYPYRQDLGFSFAAEGVLPDKTIYSSIDTDAIFIKNTDYSTKEDFVASLGDAELIYQLAIPTTEQLTTTENASIAGLRTFTPQTHAQNNAQTDMTVEAYAGTANGQAVADLKSELKITQSDTLTLTTSGWSNNAQVIAYAHDTAKRNVIDVDPSSVEEWASCGVLATAETASGITFSCKTVPTNALNFRVTSMGVN